MMRKDISAKVLAMALSISMPAGICVPAAAVYAAEESNGVQESIVENVIVSEEPKGEEGKAESGENVSLEDTGSETRAAVESGQFVLMNIPYDDFYKAEIINDVQVDAFTSATLNKTRTGGNTHDGLAAGSYHVNADGSDITGVVYPVKVGDGVDLSGFKEVKDSDTLEITVTNRGQTSVTSCNGLETLFENPSYSYYTLGEDQIPDYYKEVTSENGKLVFGKAQGAVVSVNPEDVDVTLGTDTSYGDYGMKVTQKGTGEVPDFLKEAKVYGVVIGTDTNGYGLRHMENIWRKYDLAWCTGFTTTVHNGPTSSEHYKSMMGQTIRKVTYFTDKGIYEIGLEGIYVPVKFNYTLETADAPAEAGTTQMKVEGLPGDYVPRYEVSGLAGAMVSGQTLSYAGESAEKGQYTLQITDQNGKYAPISTTFELYVNAPAAYNSSEKKLVLESGHEEKDFVDYVSSIVSAEVNGKSYAASGRNSVKLINEDGTLITDAEPIQETGSYHIVLKATGYAPVEFNYSPDMNFDGLRSSIQKAQEMKADGYTAASWQNMQTALKTANGVLKTAASQAEIDSAAAQLDKAVSGLAKSRPKTGSVVTAGTIKYQVKTSSTVTAAGPSSKSASKVSIPASVVINGFTYKVTGVANQAFSGCTKLKTVSIGKNVSTIGTKAFYGDKNLKTVTLKTSSLAKSKIGANAFKNIKASCTFKVPSKKVKSYTKIFQAKGAGKKIKVKKI